MNRDDKIVALVLEVHGIDVEMQELLSQLRTLKRTIEGLEADKAKLELELHKLRWPQQNFQ